MVKRNDSLELLERFAGIIENSARHIQDPKCPLSAKTHYMRAIRDSLKMTEEYFVLEQGGSSRIFYKDIPAEIREMFEATINPKVRWLLFENYYDNIPKVVDYQCQESFGEFFKVSLILASSVHAVIFEASGSRSEGFNDHDFLLFDFSLFNDSDDLMNRLPLHSERYYFPDGSDDFDADDFVGADPHCDMGLSTIITLLKYQQLNKINSLSNDDEKTLKQVIDDNIEYIFRNSLIRMIGNFKVWKEDKESVDKEEIVEFMKRDISHCKVQVINQLLQEEATDWTRSNTSIPF